MQQNPRSGRYAPAQNAVPAATVASGVRYPDVYELHRTQALLDAEQIGHQIRFTTAGQLQFAVAIWSDTLIRFRYDFQTVGPDLPYGLAQESPDPAVAFSLHENDTQFVIQTSTLEIVIQRLDGQVEIRDRVDHELVFRQSAPLTARETLMKGLEQLHLELSIHPEERFYGLGDKPTLDNLRGHYYENWCTDSFAYQKDWGTLYRTIPFFYGLRRGKAYGFYLNNSWRSHFDFDTQEQNQLHIWTEGGPFDFFFLYGPSMQTVAQQYHHLTGVPELPPLWALGFHQCRWSYFPDSRVREIAQTFRALAIPCDAIYLDIDYMDGYRCFTWNEHHFPDPKQLIDELRAAGFQTVVMIDPGIRIDPDYFVYRDGMESDVFCRRSSGDLMTGPVWPPHCVWPDYTNPAVRQWWGALYQDLYLKDGVSGFWNDMNEPAVFKIDHSTFPDAVNHHFEGQGSDHRKAHNIYGQQMSRATYDGLKLLKPNKRPFLLCRASFSGGQRYAALWTGDNIASWEHLRIANVQCQRLSISGFSLVGTDIGGFSEHPTGELLVRWLQLGIFHPVFRIHSMGNNTDGAAEVDAKRIQADEARYRLDQEPWAFGAPYTDQARRAIEFRYELLPYLYTAFREHIQTGVPLLQSLVFYDQTDPECQRRQQEFLCGPDLLVSPITRPNPKFHPTYLPKGNWYDFHTGQARTGGRSIRVSAVPDLIPLFVRAGAIIPLFPARAHTGLLPANTLHLRAYVADKGEGSFYWDTGDGYAYLEGEFIELRLEQQLQDRSWQLRIQREGNYAPAIDEIALKVYGLPFAPKSVQADGNALDWNQELHALELRVPFTTGTIAIR